ncbi:hypothetical protein [Micromonospora sp. NPDC047134]|uniref:hypothetical protein n=1 Tax=Micromonospora sp. NPDC047134 TaxID=3154340 RepID=UPI0033E74382
MIKAAPLPQTYLKNVAGISVTPAHRRRLESLDLIEVTPKPRIILELTDKGWERAAQELGAEPPARAGTTGGTLYVVLDFLRRLIDHSGTRADDLFRMQIKADEVALTPQPVAAGSADPVTRIRQAYHGLAGGPGDYVMLADLRAALGDLPRAEFDAALIQLNQERNVHLVPESNQKVLRPQERAAAVHIGNQDKHLIAISS